MSAVMNASVKVPALMPSPSPDIVVYDQRHALDESQRQDLVPAPSQQGLTLDGPAARKSSEGKGLHPWGSAWSARSTWDKEIVLAALVDALHALRAALEARRPGSALFWAARDADRRQQTILRMPDSHKHHCLAAFPHCAVCALPRSVRGPLHVTCGGVWETWLWLATAALRLTPCRR